MSRTALIATLLALSTTPAAADANEDVWDGMSQYATEANHLEDQLSRGLDTRRTPEGCTAVIDAARKAGIPADHELRALPFERVPGARKVGSSFILTMRQAHTVCTRYSYWRKLATAHEVLEETQRTIERLGMIDLASHAGGSSDWMVALANRCTDVVDRVIAAGVEPDRVLEITAGVNLTLRQGKLQICDKLAATAKTFVADAQAAKEARYAAQSAPYTKVGITGDRLALFIDRQGYAWYGVGGGEITAPRGLKKASVLFTLSQAADRIWTLTRYQFRGDRLIKSTSEEFLLMPGIKAYR
jgi:hypothetical protein